MVKTKVPPRKKKGTTSRTSRRTTVARKKKPIKKESAFSFRGMPDWLRNLLAVAIVCLFTSFFYYFFIRPYSYRWKPCYGMKGYGVCMPHGYSVHGIDISHYQGTIDWPLLSQNSFGDYPIRFVFMKATEGGDLKDKTFENNFEQARKHGFIRGAYHFYNPKTDALKQADFFIENVRLEAGDLPPVLDVEITGKKSTKELQEGVKEWLFRVETHYGVKPIIYASYKFKMKFLNDSIFNTFPYWIAHYYVDSVRYTGQWDFWQHSDVGNVPGIKGAVDLNVFNGSTESLQELVMKHNIAR